MIGAGILASASQVNGRMECKNLDSPIVADSFLSQVKFASIDEALRGALDSLPRKAGRKRPVSALDESALDDLLGR